MKPCSAKICSRRRCSAYTTRTSPLLPNRKPRRNSRLGIQKAHKNQEPRTNNRLISH